MKQTNRTRWASAVLLVLCVGMAGCGKKVPVNVGEADISALGFGVGRELKAELGRGDTVLVFGVPNPIGYTEELERAIVRGLEHQLKGVGARVLRVEYTEDEYERYAAGRYENLHANFASSAMDRYVGKSPSVILSLMGWPDSDQEFLPNTATFVGISWGGPIDPSHWKGQFRQVLAVHSLHGPIEGRPSRDALKHPEQVLEWFDERFDIQRGGV